MRKLLALSFSLLGCGLEPEGTPGDLSDILSSYSQLVLNSAGDELTLQYVTNNSGCFRLVPTTATVNGELMEARSLGSGTPFDGQRVPRDQCVRPSWVVPKRPVDEAVTEFVLSDPSAEVRARFQAVGAKPTASLIVPDGGIHPGQRIEVEWTPATDVLRLEQFRFGHESDAGIEYWSPVPSVVSGGIPIDVPADARSGTLSIYGKPAVGVELCEPAGWITCSFVRTLDEVDGFQRLVVPLTILP